VNRQPLLAHLIHPAVNLVTIFVGSRFHFADPANYFGIASAADDFSMPAAEYAYEFEHLTKPIDSISFGLFGSLSFSSQDTKINGSRILLGNGDPILFRFFSFLYSLY